MEVEPLTLIVQVQKDAARSAIEAGAREAARNPSLTNFRILSGSPEFTASSSPRIRSPTGPGEAHARP
jgi:hypothetical protein